LTAVAAAACALWLAVMSGRALQGQPPAGARAALEQAVTDFLAGRITESVAGFDRVVQLAPDAMPDLWQRGIALYYADRFRDCRAQFEAHRKVNPADVENAAWHYLCVARAETPERAQAALLPVGTDQREPMREIYQMFAGRVSIESVLVAGDASPSARFYASLYVGLYLEARGQSDRARFYIAQAASDEFARVAGYMNSVAKVHMQVRRWPPTSKEPAR
jgi:lipoprotein NlpI